jgi:glycosyltransferase involved in cell wall biosynthesis
MNKSKVSIVIRGKNESKWLKILFKEIRLQSYKNYEIIYCDNGSKDYSINVAKKNKVRKIINIKRYTPGHSLNEGIKKSSGEYIIFLSSHCIPHSADWIKVYVNFMESHRNITAAYGKQIPLPGTSTKDLLDLDILFSKETGIDQNNYLNNANAIYRTTYLKKNLFNKNLTNIEDRKWLLDQKKNKIKIAFIKEAGVFHIHGINQHESNSDRSVNTSKILNSKYKKYWNNCAFLRNDYFKYMIVINDRRNLGKEKMISKLKKLINYSFFKKLHIKNILIISNENYSINLNNIKIRNIIPSNSLSNDLKKIYNKNLLSWNHIDYIISINAQAIWNYKNLKNIINLCIKNSCDSVSIAEKIYGNFIVNFNDGAAIKSLTLDKRENKPTLEIMKWTEGCVFIPSYLIYGKYVDEKTKFYYK